MKDNDQHSHYKFFGVTFRCLAISTWSGCIISSLQLLKPIWISLVIAFILFIVCFRVGFLGKSQLQNKLGVDLGKDQLGWGYSLKDFFADMTISFGASILIIIADQIFANPLNLLFAGFIFTFIFLCISKALYIVSNKNK